MTESLQYVKSVKYIKKFKPKKILIISTGSTFHWVKTEEGLIPKFDEASLREHL